VFAGHFFPQVPQLSLSVFRSTQPFPQLSRPGRQVAEQVPAEHASAPVHFTPHPPQLFGSTVVGMQAPLQND
jgi:hypothetical protein